MLTVDVVNAKELKKIKSRFDTSGKSNVVPMDTILHMPEVMMSPFFERYLRMNVKDDAVPFETFLAALGLFSPKMKMDVKKYALFQLYDVDQDGYITSIDLATILYYRFSSRISGIQLHSICGNAIDAQRNALTKNNDADGWTYEQFNEVNVILLVKLCNILYNIAYFGTGNSFLYDTRLIKNYASMAASSRDAD